MKILIIEDEIQLVKSVALALREEGYVCEFAFTDSTGLGLAIVKKICDSVAFILVTVMTTASIPLKLLSKH